MLRTAVALSRVLPEGPRPQPTHQATGHSVCKTAETEGPLVLGWCCGGRCAVHDPLFAGHRKSWRRRVRWLLYTVGITLLRRRSLTSATRCAGRPSHVSWSGTSPRVRAFAAKTLEAARVPAPRERAAAPELAVTPGASAQSPVRALRAHLDGIRAVCLLDLYQPVPDELHHER